LLRQGASFTFDLADQGAGLGLPENWFGSAVVSATTNSGELTAVSNFFIGADAMLTFGGFTNPGTKWVAPLFTSRLATNQLSTPLTVQNLGTAEIPARAVQVVCKPNSASGVTTDVVLENGSPIPVNASFSWNPVTDTSIPTDFQGSCTINTGSNPTVAFVQMRFIGTNNAAAYEALRGDSTDTTVVVPLVLRRLPNGFATAVTVSNFGDQPATVLLSYKAAAEAPPNLKCDGSLTLTIPAGGSIVQNHRVQNGAVNAVPEIDEGCTSSLIVTPAGGAPQPIGAFVQITTINNQPGDTYQAHDAFGIQ
jgi:hypothetical protein